MALHQKLMTAEELLAMPDDGMKHELVRGVLYTMPPPGRPHGRVSARICVRLGSFIETNGLGEALTESGYRLGRDPDTVRAPDFAYISMERLAGAALGAYPDLAPDLVVEIVSPSESARDIREKVEQWLAAGTRMAVAAYPETRSLRVYRTTLDVRTLGPEDRFEGEDVLPGFSCLVRDLFPE